MILTESDKNNIMNLYEAIRGNPNRFAGVNPTHVEIIKSAERKMELSYDLVNQVDPFYYSTLAKMLPDDRNKMVLLDIPTMQTDGKLLFYNPAFVNKLSVDAVFTVVTHEICHVVFGHHILFAHIDPKNRKLWHIVNIACDLAINDLLKNRQGFIEGGLILAGRGEFKDLPVGLNAKQYFDLLVKKYTGEPPQTEDGEQGEDGESGEDKDEGSDEGSDEGTGEGEGEGAGEGMGEGEGEGTGEGEGAGEGTGEGEGEGTGEGGTGGGVGGTGSVEGTGEGDYNLPSFSDFAKQADETKKAASEKGKAAPKTPKIDQNNVENNLVIPQSVIDDYQKTGELKAPTNITEKNQNNAIAEHEKEIEEARSDADQYEEEAAKRGVSYDEARNKLGVGDWKDALVKETSLNWREILREFLNVPSPERPSYNRPPKRFVDMYGQQGLIPYGMVGQSLKELCFLVDVSGSMSDYTVKKVFGEVAAIGKDLTGKCSVRLVTFNTRIQSENLFTTSGNNFESIRAMEDGRRERLSKEYIMDFKEMPDKFASFKFVKTGGGTNITSALTAVKNIKPRPALAIVFTDGDFMQSEYDSLRGFTDDGLKIIFLLTTIDTSRKQNNKYFNKAKYSVFENVGTVYNLNDYSVYIPEY